MIETLARGGLVPSAIAFATAYLVWRFWPPSIARRYTFPLALTAGFVTGYALLPEWAEWIPVRHWQWLPWLAGIAAITGPVVSARGVLLLERLLLILIISLAAAYWIVPDWSSLEPPRHWYVALVSVYLFTLAAGLTPLADQVSARSLAIALSATAAVTAAAILIAVSARYAQLAGVAAAALIGGSLHVVLVAGSVPLRSVMPLYALLVGGMAFVGYIEPEPPLAGLLVLPAAPLAMWICRLIPAGEGNWWTVAGPFTGVAVVLGIGVGWTML